MYAMILKSIALLAGSGSAGMDGMARARPEDRGDSGPYQRLRPMPTLFPRFSATRRPRRSYARVLWDIVLCVLQTYKVQYTETPNRFSSWLDEIESDIGGSNSCPATAALCLAQKNPRHAATYSIFYVYRQQKLTHAY